MFEHNGIILRHAEESDLERLLELKNESWFGTHRVTIQTMEAQRDWWAKASRSVNDYIMIASKEAVDVGVYKVTNIDWINGLGDSAHDVFKESRGQRMSYPVLSAGVAFAFSVLNLRRLNTEVLVGNHSRKAAIKCGFIHEGLRRGVRVLNGEQIDSEVFGMLRDETQVFNTPPDL